MTSNEYTDVRVEEHRRCVQLIEEFAEEYVRKWVDVSGDGAKAAGWAILQAAVHLRKQAPQYE